MLLILWPNDALATIFMLMGVMFIIMGFVSTFIYFGMPHRIGRSAFEIVVAIVQIIVGIFFIVRSDALIAFFPIIAAIVLLYGACIMCVYSFRFRKYSKYDFIFSLILALLVLVFAILVFADPVFMANVITQVTGIFILFEGVFLLIVLSRALIKVKDVEKDINDAKDSIIDIKDNIKENIDSQINNEDK